MEKQQSIWRLPVLWKLLKASFNGLKQNDPLRMAGATAFFTSFALPPIIVLLFQLFSIFFSRQLVRTEMGEALSTTLGKESAEQLRSTARGFRNLAHNWYMAVIGLVFLIFIATTLFKVIRNTLNDIWNIRIEKTGFIYDLKVRGKSLVILFTAAILFLTSGILDLIQAIAGNYIRQLWPKAAIFLTGVINEIAGVVVVAVWFIVVFRFLANARPSWRAASIGGILTGVLFYIGKTILSTIMSNSNAGAIYGAGAAIVLILLFVFYASFILYFGASFIKEYSLLTNDPIVPTSGAYQFKLQKVTDAKKNDQIR
jgi:membrane protein